MGLRPPCGALIVHQRASEILQDRDRQAHLIASSAIDNCSRDGSLNSDRSENYKFGGALSRANCMNEFRLFAHGVEFAPDAYLATSPLKFDGVWRKGESGRDHPKSSGLFKVLGDGRTLSLFEQEWIAIEYLSANREELKSLAQHPQVTTLILGLQYHIVLNFGTIGFCMGPSDLLMWHCLDIGISFNYYVSLDREREWAGEQDAEPGDAEDDGGI